MTLKRLMNEISDKAFEAMKDGVRNDDDCACTCVDTNEGWIDIMITRDGYVEAVITHEKDNSVNSPLLEAFCETTLKELDWEEAEEEVRGENAMTPEEEYYRCKPTIEIAGNFRRI